MSVPYDHVTVVTGPLRSGTSCLTGLLEYCGFDLGRNIRVLRKPTEHNPKGHFEADLLFTINSRLLFEAGEGDGIFQVPDAQALADLAANRPRYFQLFLRKFDGELCKDPLFCLTLRHWEAHWPALRRAIFCLRHPMAVARSIEKRYGISIQEGLELWQTYSTRFFCDTRRCEIFVFDFDAFQRKPQAVFTQVLDWLDRPQPEAELQKQLIGVWDETFVHWAFDETKLQSLPGPVRDWYLMLQSNPGPWRGSWP
jgi:hypothetical protein